MICRSAATESLRIACIKGGHAVEEVDHDEMRQLAVTENPQGVVVLFRPPVDAPTTLCRGMPFRLILDGLADPGNLGTILRTVWAVGLPEVWLVRGTTDPFAPKAVRAGMGAQFAIRTEWLDSLSEAAEQLNVANSGALWLAVPRGGVSAFSDGFQPEGGALVIGGEAHGVSDTTCGNPVHLPMPGDAESLNAAQAATVFLFELLRRGVLTEN